MASACAVRRAAGNVFHGAVSGVQSETRFGTCREQGLITRSRRWIVPGGRQLLSAAEREHSLRRHDEGASETRRRAGAGTLSASASSGVVRMSRRAGERMAMVTTAEGRMSRRIGGASGGKAAGAAARSSCLAWRRIWCDVSAVLQNQFEPERTRGYGFVKRSIVRQGKKEEQIYFLGYFLQSFPTCSHEYSLKYFLEVYFIKNFVKHTLEYFL